MGSISCVITRGKTGQNERPCTHIVYPTNYIHFRQRAMNIHQRALCIYGYCAMASGRTNTPSSKFSSILHAFELAFHLTFSLFGSCSFAER